MCRGGAIEAGILDGLAQVRLAGGKLDDCERILAKISGPTGAVEAVPTWYRVWALVTRLRLLLRRGAAAESLALASDLLSISGPFDDPSLAHLLQLLQAEALLMAGRPADATELVCAVADAGGAEPLETLPRVGRMFAKLHQAHGNRAAAADWFEHAARVLASAGDECARAELLQEYAELLWPTVGRPGDRPSGPPARPLPEWLCLRPTARRITVHPGEATPLGPGAPPVSIAAALERAATLIDLAGRPQCVGQELQDVLGRCGAITNAAVVSRADAAPPEVLAFWGDYRRLDDLLSAAGGVERIGLGRWRDKDVELLAEVGAGLDSRAAVIAARKLVKASLELEAARRERRERAALWPLEEPIESRYGVFASQAMTELVATARKIGPSNVTVLITGETGTGKEVLARIIHDASPRASRPFIPFNCAAVPRDMLDSQLFGYRRGAFTGAFVQFPGVIRGAAGGTLLLDEIGEIPPDLQPKLLRFLEAQEIQPLGETHPVPVDVRVLAATNADLDQLLASGRFREDLYYRLNVIRLRVPPLRERREEIPVLVQHFLKRFAEENRKDNLRLAEETMEYLLLYSWPGNVRELLNQMRRLVALAENGAVLMPEHLPPEIVGSRRTRPASELDLAPTEIVVRLDQPLAAAVEHVERAILPWAMRSAGGRVDLAAKILGLSRKGLYLKRQRLGLEGGDTLAAAGRPERD
jgi:DNA-binding NtrC family response regulator